MTTLPKAKELRPFVEKLVTLAKKGDLNSRRIAIGRMRNKEQAKKLFDILGPRYADRQGGYIRIMKAASAMATTPQWLLSNLLTVMRAQKAKSTASARKRLKRKSL